ncbi:MAG: two-component system response regulator CreB [Betaproteobacteria bacterium]|nr:two-component system response regulator CreB [Betaproteobacteria bacterium]
MPRATILIAEDESAIADALAVALAREGFRCVHARLAAEARRLVGQEKPDLVVLDVGLQDGSGFDLCREWLATSDLPIVFLTARNDEIDRVLGLELGADDYIVKPFSLREVVARVRAILRRLSKARAQRGGPASRPAGASLFQMDEGSMSIEYCGHGLDLTRYEYLLLRTLLADPERICSRAQLMERVWADALETGDRTVDAHVKMLRAKLRAVTLDHEPIVTHRGLGYSIDPTG